MGMKNNDPRFLNEKIVLRIGKPVAPPADSEQRMFFNHGNRAFPESKTEHYGCVLPREKRENPFRDLPVIKKQHQRYQKKNKTETFIVKNGKSRHNSCQTDPCSAGICESQTNHERCQKNGKPCFSFPVLIKKEKGNGCADYHQKIRTVKVRVFQGGKHSSFQQWKPFGIHPGLCIQILSHHTDIRVLEAPPKNDADRTGKKNGKGSLFFFLCPYV